MFFLHFPSGYFKTFLTSSVSTRILICPTHTTWSTHINLLYVMTLTSVERYKIRNSTLWKFCSLYYACSQRSALKKPRSKGFCSPGTSLWVNGWSDHHFPVKGKNKILDTPTPEKDSTVLSQNAGILLPSGENSYPRRTAFLSTALQKNLELVFNNQFEKNLFSYFISKSSRQIHILKIQNISLFNVRISQS